MTEASEIEEVVAFDVWGDYGHFRKNYTTSSPLTHEIPPRTALTGLLGAIMGYPRSGENNYHRVFAPTQAKIAVVPRRRLEKQRFNKNMLKIKGETAKLIRLATPPSEITRNQVPFEFLRQPRYTLYLWHDNAERLDTIASHLDAHRSVYTPSLGLSELLAQFEYRGRFSANQAQDDGHVDGVVNANQCAVEFERGKQYNRENVSLVMDEERVVQRFSDVIYAESTADDEPIVPIKIQDGSQYQLSDDAPDEAISFLTG